MGFNNINWMDVREEIPRESAPDLKAGKYKCKIIDVVDIVDKGYVAIYLDIVDGDFAGHFEKLYVRDKEFAAKKGEDINTIKRRAGSILYQSYSPNSIGYFKMALRILESCNNGKFKISNTLNLNSLKGLKLPIMFDEEIYNDKVRLKPRILTVDQFKNDEIKPKLVDRNTLTNASNQKNNSNSFDFGFKTDNKQNNDALNDIFDNQQNTVNNQNKTNNENGFWQLDDDILF